MLEARAERVKAARGAVAKAHLRSSDRPAAEIVSVAEEMGAGLIAMGSRGLGGIRRALLGSVPIRWSAMLRAIKNLPLTLEANFGSPRRLRRVRLFHKAFWEPGASRRSQDPVALRVGVLLAPTS